MGGALFVYKGILVGDLENYKRATVQFFYNAMFDVHRNRPCYKGTTLQKEL